jgi:hypothetical protein
LYGVVIHPIVGFQNKNLLFRIQTVHIFYELGILYFGIVDFDASPVFFDVTEQRRNVMHSVSIFEFPGFVIVLRKKTALV